MKKINLEKIKDCIEMEISSQGFIKNNWKLIKKYKDKSNNYYALIECVNCGKKELVNYYNFIREDKQVHPCKECKWKIWANSMIGKIINNNKILSVEKIKYSKNDTAQVYFNVKCTKCGHIHVKLYNETNWKLTEGCVFCNKKFNDPFITSIYKGYIDGAKQRNLSWELSDELFIKLINSNCYYCGSKPQYKERKLWNTLKSGYYTGIDRIDSNLGYTENNIVPCCSLCNMMKNNLSKDEFINHINEIYNYNIEQGSTTISKESTSKSMETENSQNGK